MPADPAEAKQLTERIKTYKAKLTEATAMHRTLQKATMCHMHTGNWEALARVASAADREIASMMAQLISKDASRLSVWASNQSSAIDKGPGSDWWSHAMYASGVLTSLAQIQKVQPTIDILLVLAPLSSDRNHSLGIPSHAAQAQEFTDKFTSLASQLVGEVMIPQLPKDAQRLGVLKKFLATYDTGKPLGVSSVSPISTSSFQEREGGKLYTVVQKTYASYYVWKPLKTHEVTPTIAGIKPDELCELWLQKFYMYEKGGPSKAPLKKWRASESLLVSTMLCSNKDKWSKRVAK
jgi:hypothetical protein